MARFAPLATRVPDYLDRARHSMVLRGVDEGTAAWHTFSSAPSPCERQRPLHAAPEHKVHQVWRRSVFAGSAKMAARHAPSCGPARERSKTRSLKEACSARTASFCQPLAHTPDSPRAACNCAFTPVFHLQDDGRHVWSASKRQEPRCQNCKGSVKTVLQAWASFVKIFVLHGFEPAQRLHTNEQAHRTSKQFRA